MRIQLGLVASIALSLNFASLGLPAGSVTRLILAPVMAQTTDERKVEAERLLQLCREQLQANQFEAALQSCEQSATQFEAIGDKGKQGRSTNNIGIAYAGLGQQQQAIEQYQMALPLVREAGDQEAEGIALVRLITAYGALNQYSEAIASIQQLLTLAKEAQNSAWEGTALALLSVAYVETGAYQQAIEPGEQALPLIRKANDQNAEVQVLNYLSWAYQNLSQYQKALDSAQQALLISRQTRNQNGEANALNNLANAYQSLSQYREAIEHYQQALPIFQAIGNRTGEAKVLVNLGNASQSLSQYREAIEYYQQALPIFQAVKDRNSEALTLNNLGTAYSDLSQVQQAIEYYQQALPIFQAVKDRNSEASTLNNLGTAYSDLSQVQQAIDYHQQALAIFQQVGNRNGEANALLRLGRSYHAFSQYGQAVQFYQEALLIYQRVGDRKNEAWTLNNLALLYQDLGEYQQAVKFLEQALPIFQQIGGRDGESSTLFNLGATYWYLKQPQQTIELFQQALPVFQEIGNRDSTAAVLNGLGYVQWSLNQYQKASESLQQALAIRLETGSHMGEAVVLHNLGLVSDSLGQHQTALNYFYQALSIFQSIGARDQEAQQLATLGESLEKQNQPELAIVFLKNSVNTFEEIRGELQSLPSKQQQAFTDKISETYRRLANLLLSQKRILEAQQVLDLLKLEELREYTRNARSFETDAGIALNATEQKIISDHGTIVAFGQKVADCERANCPDLKTLTNQRRNLNDAYDRRVSELIKIIRDNRQKDKFYYDPTYISESARAIVAEPGTVLIYPFVQDDQLWLIWTAAGDVVGSKVIEVNQKTLGETVIRFRELLQNPQSDLTELQATGKQLYDWLIQPIETELKVKGQPITHLVFAQDRILRYLPMSALYDGSQYLIQRYQVSTILSAELTDMNDRLTPGTSGNNILALGLSNSVNGLNPLPNVTTELDQIVRVQGSDPNGGIYPGQEFLNQAFNLAALEQNLRHSRIVHIATHGKFVAGSPEQSYLVLGNGDPFPIQQIDRLGSDLRNVNLVVLSACETALGGTGADGIEVAGISSYFLAAKRASTVMASLWAVNDNSTSLLMQQFYQDLAKGISKAEALQKAQLSLLAQPTVGNNQSTRSDVDMMPNGGVALTARSGATPSGYAHPYYWAPFILIGSGQ